MLYPCHWMMQRPMPCPCLSRSPSNGVKQPSNSSRSALPQGFRPSCPHARARAQARKAFAVSVVAASKALDELAVDALAPGETTIDASEQQFVDAQLAEQLQRAAALLKRLRACNRALMEEGLPEAKHHRGAGGSP